MLGEVYTGGKVRSFWGLQTLAASGDGSVTWALAADEANPRTWFHGFAELPRGDSPLTHLRLPGVPGRACA